MTRFSIGTHTFTNKKFYTEAEQEETRSVALVGLPAEGNGSHGQLGLDF